MKPRVCILITEGTSTGAETLYAFEKAGGSCALVHIDQLKNGTEKLQHYQILVLPGGFSGDEVHAGKILAVELGLYLKEQLNEFVARGKPVLGIGDGFQVLAATGLLPRGRLGEARVSLMANDSGRFHCRWVHLRVEQTNCIFTRGMEDTLFQCQVAHGEGKFYAPPEVLQELEQAGQVVFRYANPDTGEQTPAYPHNPDGSLGAIAGICDPSGLVLGLGPHPERAVEFYHHPNWRRPGCPEPRGILIFRNAVEYVAGS